MLDTKVILLDNLFEITDVFGKKIRTTENYWRKIKQEKHQDLKLGIEDIKETIIKPNEVFRSIKDDSIMINYRSFQSETKEGEKTMAKVKIFLDPVSNTMNLWWNDPKKAFTSEETDDKNSNDVIVKDRHGKPIGVEVIGLLPSELNVAKWWKNYLGIKKDQPFLLNG